MRSGKIVDTIVETSGDDCGFVLLFLAEHIALVVDEEFLALIVGTMGEQLLTCAHF